MHSPERPHHFNPRPPRGGRLVVHQQLRHQLVQFQSTPPARGTTTHQLPDAARPPISIHAPREGDDFVDGASRQYRYISIHAPREGDDGAGHRTATGSPYFNPRPPRGGRLRESDRLCRQTHISIHAPREGDDGRSSGGGKADGISIHAPREGDDSELGGGNCHTRISIHAPREGDDLSSAVVAAVNCISIHAPREGDDDILGFPIRHQCSYFNPRPPRGGRRLYHRKKYCPV